MQTYPLRAGFETLSDHQAVNGYSDLTTYPPYLSFICSFECLSTQLPNQTNLRQLQAPTRSLFRPTALPDA
jgi:hypothetical protein